MQLAHGLLDDRAWAAHVHARMAAARRAEHRPLVQGQMGAVDKEVDHLVVLQPQCGAVEPQQEACLGPDGDDARQVLLAVVDDIVDIALDVAQALFEPLLAMAIGRLGGDD